MRQHNSGFTLIEVLIVIVIIGILSALMISSAFRPTTITAESEVRATLLAAAHAQERHATVNGTYHDGPATTLPSWVEYTPPAGVTVTFTVTADGKNYCAEATNAETTFSFMTNETVLQTPCAGRGTLQHAR